MTNEEAIRNINELKSDVKMHTLPHIAEIINESLEMSIEALEQTRWIPCSERLPEEEKRSYWICTDSGYQCECRWTNVNPFWTDLTTEWHWNIFDISQFSKVLAWMPLPQPYKAESED